MIDLELALRAAQRGDAHGFRALFERFHPAILGYCLTSVRGDRIQADDLAQETMVRAFKSIGSVEQASSLRSWFYRIAENVCRTRFSREQRRRAILAELARAIEHDLEATRPVDLEERHAMKELALQILGRIEDPVL